MVYSTVQLKCPSPIKIRVSRDGTKLVVREMCEQHNHHVSQSSYHHLQQKRCVHTEIKQEVAKMLQLKANKELVLEHVLQSTGKIRTLKNLHNGTAAKKPPHSDNNLVTLLEEMKKEPGRTTEVVGSDESELQAIFYEDARECEPSPAKKLKIESRQNQDRQRPKTRINIGVAFPRWRSLMKLKGFQNDDEVTCFLLDCYEKAPVASTSRRGKLQAPAVSCIADTNRNDKSDDG
ncbi:uncharacterized protein LOC115432972 [Sphaeramia orbicularis]|uniref:uncharacterized protein LOC115432972 n=1 Tax=Sphaeramia orbicularis TaxID=375764 RepID=UPI00117FEB54|nr:uncharacterized protein LOC115432972 [Sphaeramia orbicularis]